LFAVFGLKMLRDGFKMSANEGQDELEEVQADLRRKDDEVMIILLNSFNFANFLLYGCYFMI